MSPRTRISFKDNVRAPHPAGAALADDLQSERSWTRVPLGSIATVQLGKMLSAKARRGDGARPYLRNINVRWHRIDVSDVLYMDFDDREHEKYTLRRGDVLVCEGGEPGRAAVWNEQMPGVMYQKALHRVRIRDSILDPRLLAYQLELDARSGVLQSQFTGSTILHLPRETFLAYPVLVPPRAEQQRIIEELEASLSHLDAAQNGLLRAHANARRLCDAVADVSIEGLDHVPLAELLAEPLANGRSVPSATSGFPVLRLSSIRQGSVDYAACKMGAWSAAEADTFLVREGDFLVVRGNGSLSLVGRGGVAGPVPTPVAFPDTLIRVRPNSARISTQYLRLVWHTRAVRRQVESRARTTAGIYKISQADLHQITIPLATRSEQDRIVASAASSMVPADRIRMVLALQQARAARLRVALLARTFRHT